MDKSTTQRSKVNSPFIKAPYLPVNYDTKQQKRAKGQLHATKLNIGLSKKE